MKKYVQYGCGLSAPEGWINFDSSPTLRIQRTPLIGTLLKGKLNTIFPPNVKYGDIIKGLPIESNSCDGIYCSHVLEHLSLSDFKLALKNTYSLLKPGGIFQIVMPDLEALIDSYIGNKVQKTTEASIIFIRNSGMGSETRAKGFKALLELIYGNSRHLWLWDKQATVAELEKAGFKQIKQLEFHKNSDTMFDRVQDKDRFKSAIAFEMTK